MGSVGRDSGVDTVCCDRVKYGWIIRMIVNM